MNRPGGVCRLRGIGKLVVPERDVAYGQIKETMGLLRLFDPAQRHLDAMRLKNLLQQTPRYRIDLHGIDVAVLCNFLRHASKNDTGPRSRLNDVATSETKTLDDRPQRPGDAWIGVVRIWRCRTS